MRLAALLLLSACSFGPSYFDCSPIEVDAVRASAERRGVLPVLQRMDFFCESRVDVERDCRNPKAEACTLWIGSTFARGRTFLSRDEPHEITALALHEVQHWALWDRPSACASHSPSCGWIEDSP